jgi:NTE family protein
MDSGSLSNALRASSSVTFFLAPIKKDSMLLIDGGLVANIPVDIAKKNGGDFVIAVNTTSELWPEKDLSIPWIIADQIVSIPMKQNNADQLNAADFVVTPELKSMLSTDFDLVDSLIFLGYSTTIPHVNRIKEKIDSITYNSLPEE